MAEKGVAKKTREHSYKKKRKAAVRTTTHRVVVQTTPQKEIKLDPLLLENFVSLQRVFTNLSVKLDNLSTQISKLLDLFEISAKALAEKDFDLESGNKDLAEKLNSLVDQNKTLARGLTLLHERIPGQEVFIPPMLQQQMPPQYMQSQQYMPSQMSPQQMIPPREFSPPPKKQKPLLTKTREFDEFTQETPSSNSGPGQEMGFP